MSDPPTFRIPEPDEILIEPDGDVPVTVERIDNGDIVALTPDGEEILIPLEHDLHRLDEFDL